LKNLDSGKKNCYWYIKTYTHWTRIETFRRWFQNYNG